MRLFKLVLTVAAVAAFSAAVASQTTSGHAVFEQALAKERVEGNLQEAIRLYERVVTEFASDRALAAQALVQVGLCYEKLGRDEAVRAYERLVRDFADQEDAVAQARVRLAVLKRPAPGAAPGATTSGVRAFPRVDTNNEVLALSPDGTKAVFYSFAKGQNLAVYDVASQQTTFLTDFDWTPTTPAAIFAVWSPDGRRIAHLQCPKQNIRGCELRIATLTGESKVIAGNEAAPVGQPVAWLPDGSALVVALVRPDRTVSLGLLSTSGGPFTQLRSISGWTGGPFPPVSVSPDGRWIAFTEGAPRDIHVIGRDGRMAHRITDHPADDHQPLWSPDGRHLAFLSNRNGSTALWTLAIKDGQPDGDAVRVKDGMQYVFQLLGWTARGLAYSEYLRTDDVYTVPVDPASGEPNGAPRQIPYQRTGRNVAPVWSPDGRYLAFISSSPAEPDRRAVVLLPSGGGEPREFPIPASRRHIYQLQVPYDLRWFGDSRGLGFSGVDARGEYALFRLTLATGEWKTVPLPVFETWIEWNADGSRVFYALSDQTGDQAGHDRQIVERDLQSDRERIVYRWKPENPTERYRGLRFSADRRSLSFRGTGGIHVLDIETGQARVVYDKAVGETLDDDSAPVPTWSPAGRALLLPRTVKQATDLRLIPIDASEVRRIPLSAELTRLLSPGRGAGAERPRMHNIVWSPDGGRLAFILSASRLETWVIENPLALAGAADGSARK